MANAPPHPRRTILLVDDEPEVLHLVTRILSAEDTAMIEARTGAEALAVARQTRLDLVILDIKLPDMGGTEVLRRIRGIDPGVPVIMVTSYGSVETVRTSMELGAFDYLTKPFDNREVRRVAREALASRAGGSVPSR
ncbi:MAG: response regulator, partial [Candidatus Rokubacteria bacterium]|nr:response regulator [Candidatus Rokubacteria bacterium]